jgi:hypothetical protein
MDHTNGNILSSIIFYCQPSYDRKKNSCSCPCMLSELSCLQSMQLTLKPSSWNRYVKTPNTSERDSVIVTTQEQQAESL